MQQQQHPKFVCRELKENPDLSSLDDKSPFYPQTIELYKTQLLGEFSKIFLLLRDEIFVGHKDEINSTSILDLEGFIINLLSNPMSIAFQFKLFEHFESSFKIKKMIVTESFFYPDSDGISRPGRYCMNIPSSCPSTPTHHHEQKEDFEEFVTPNTFLGFIKKTYGMFAIRELIIYIEGLFATTHVDYTASHNLCNAFLAFFTSTTIIPVDVKQLFIFRGSELYNRSLRNKSIRKEPLSFYGCHVKFLSLQDLQVNVRMLQFLEHGILSTMKLIDLKFFAALLHLVKSIS